MRHVDFIDPSPRAGVVIGNEQNRLGRSAATLSSDDGRVAETTERSMDHPRELAGVLRAGAHVATRTQSMSTASCHVPAASIAAGFLIATSSPGRMTNGAESAASASQIFSL